MTRFMCLLTEAIKVKHRKLFNLDLHAERMNKARRELFGITDEINLHAVLLVPDFVDDGLYKCRITYGKKIDNVEWIKYKPRNIKTLKLVRCDEIGYNYKFNDRSMFEKLLKENNCSDGDVIIIIKNNRITDTYFSNVVLFNGKEWHTPRFPLLLGTKRAELLRDGIIFEEDILENEFYRYEKIRLINAMIEFDVAPTFFTTEVIPVWHQVK